MAALNWNGRSFDDDTSSPSVTAQISGLKPLDLGLLEYSTFVPTNQISGENWASMRATARASPYPLAAHRRSDQYLGASNIRTSNSSYRPVRGTQVPGAAVSKSKEMANIPRRSMPMKSASNTSQVAHQLQGTELFYFDARERPGEDTVLADVHAFEHIVSDACNPLGYRYKCSYPDCDRIVVGNVAMTNHVWAHVAKWRTSAPLLRVDDGGKREMSDVDILRNCPTCLRWFNSPVDAQIHYTRAHSRQRGVVANNVCHICEKDVGNAMQAHINELHRYRYNAPYTCDCCKYRTNLRSVFFEHYATEHWGTDFLLCPYCLKGFSNSEKNEDEESDAITPVDFVNHMRAHESVRPHTTSLKRTRNCLLYLRQVRASRYVLDAISRKRGFPCSNCSLVFLSRDELIKHKSDLHSTPRLSLLYRQRKDPRQRMQSFAMSLLPSTARCVDHKLREGSTECDQCWALDNTRRLAKDKLVPWKAGASSCETLPRSKHSRVKRCHCGELLHSLDKLARHQGECREKKKVDLLTSRGDPLRRLPSTSEHAAESIEIDEFHLVNVEEALKSGEEADIANDADEDESAYDTSEDCNARRHYSRFLQSLATFGDRAFIPTKTGKVLTAIETLENEYIKISSKFKSSDYSTALLFLRLAKQDEDRWITNIPTWASTETEYS